MDKLASANKARQEKALDYPVIFKGDEFNERLDDKAYDMLLGELNSKFPFSLKLKKTRCFTSFTAKRVPSLLTEEEALIIECYIEAATGFKVITQRSEKKNIIGVCVSRVKV